jgi:UDP-N-acetylmuramate dehydrogenase
MLNAEMKNWLARQTDIDVRFDEPMAKHTTLRVGGPADAWVRVRTLNALESIVRRCRKTGTACLLVGDGTNLLVLDGGISGLVLTLAGALREIRKVSEKLPGTRVVAMGGARLAALCRFALERGLAGMNFALGIPGTIGGAVRMNAGTDRGWLSDVLVEITVMTFQAKTETVLREEMDAVYRHLTWEEAEDHVVVGAEFELKPGNPESLATEAEALKKHRLETQPTTMPSAGCFFKNPATGQPAGELMDLAGLKGARIGDAQISPRHANFIVNHGRAAAGDILRLVDLARDRVTQRFGIELEPEVKIVGNP